MIKGGRGAVESRWVGRMGDIKRIVISKLLFEKCMYQRHQLSERMRRARLLLIPLLLAAVVPYAGAKFCRFLPVDGQLSVLQSLTVEHEGIWEVSGSFKI